MQLTDQATSTNPIVATQTIVSYPVDITEGTFRPTKHQTRFCVPDEQVTLAQATK